MDWSLMLSNRIFWALSTIFWLWMLIDCVMNEPDRFMWLLIISFGNILGALLYFAVRKAPVLRYRSMPFISGFMRCGEISRAEADAHNIGNPHHYIRLGELLLETGSFSRAGEAFSRALEREPDDIQALWGAAQVDVKNKEFTTALPRLEKVLEQDFDYKYGEASLMYGRALFELKDRKARQHIQAHLVKWTQPEAKYMMGAMLAEDGRREEAATVLKAAILDMKGAPAYYRSRNVKWIWAIRLLLMQLKK